MGITSVSVRAGMEDRAEPRRVASRACIRFQTCASSFPRYFALLFFFTVTYPCCTQPGLVACIHSPQFSIERLPSIPSLSTSLHTPQVSFCPRLKVFPTISVVLHHKLNRVTIHFDRNVNDNGRCVSRLREKGYNINVPM